MLTSRQKLVLDYIEQVTHDRGGVAPSYKEIAEALDIASKNTVYRTVNALEERGFIRRLRDRARAIEVIRSSGSVSNPSHQACRVRWFRFDDETQQFVPLETSESPTLPINKRK